MGYYYRCMKCKKMVPNENGFEKYFIIELGGWDLVSLLSPFSTTSVWIYKLKYGVFVEKMALVIIGPSQCEFQNMADNKVGCCHRFWIWDSFKPDFRYLLVIYPSICVK